MNIDYFLKDKRIKFPKDSHSIFPASNYHWVNYPIEKMMTVYNRKTNAELGSKMHQMAAMLIELRQPLPDVQKTLNMYVNDAILFGMYPEKQIRFSEEFRGTCDAMVVDENDILRIHDLKTGETKTSIVQLEIYTAFLCLELNCLPSDFRDIVLRIYQNNDITEKRVGEDEILPIMDKVVVVDKLIRKMKENGAQ